MLGNPRSKSPKERKRRGKHARHDGDDMILPAPRRIPNRFTMKDLIEKMTQKQANLAFRNNAIRASNRANYHNEIDRINSMLSSTILPTASTEMLQKRRSQIKKLAAEGVHNPFTHQH